MNPNEPNDGEPLIMSVVPAAIYEEQTSRVGKILRDPKGCKWRITREFQWKNLYVDYSDKEEEGVLSNHIALVDVLKARMQIRESGLTERQSRRRRESIVAYDLFVAIIDHGITTKLEYDTFFDINDRPALDDLMGCSRHSPRDYDICTAWDDGGCYQKLEQILERDGPFFGSFYYDSNLSNFVSNRTLYSFGVDAKKSGDGGKYKSHGLMVYGTGTCQRIGDESIMDQYWLVQNTAGCRRPIGRFSHGILSYGASFIF